MRLRTRYAAAWLGLAVVLGGCSLPGQPSGHAGKADAPNFTLVGLDGKTHSLSEYRGHVVLVNYWATWCIPCRAEIPELEVSYKKHQADGVVFLGVDWKEGTDQVAPFVDERQVTYPILLDSQGKAYTAYQVVALPETFVIDKQGRIAVHRTGLATRDKFDEELKAAGA
ncbi:MAG: TlpA family protein disulfide reductase [Candidatus Dormibacteria bacterium]